MNRCPDSQTRAGLWLFPFLLGALALSFSGHGVSVDENLILQVADSFVRRGELTVSGMFQALPGPDGKHYSRYGFGFPLTILPFYALGRFFEWLAPGHPAFAGNPLMFAALFSGPVLTALLGWLFYRICLLAGGPPAGSALLAIGLALGTSFWPYAQTLYRLTFSALLLVLALWLILRNRETPSARNMAALAAVTAFALNVREDLAIALVAMGIYCLFAGSRAARLWRSASLMAGALLGTALWGLHNYIRFGHFFIENYADVHLDYPLIVSLPQLFFGHRRGLVTYSPLCVLMALAWPGRRRTGKAALFLLCAGILAAYFLLYGKSDFWHGGVCWGPRHMYFLLPFALLPAAWWLKDGARWKYVLSGALLLAGMWMNWPGVYSHQGRYQSYFEAPPFFELAAKPPESPLYVGFEDFDLWWIRMMKLEPGFLWPAAFLALAAFTLWCGVMLVRELRRGAPEPE